MSVEAPAGLLTRGIRLWEQVAAAKDLNPGELVILEEACRLTDRLDRLHQLLDGDLETWARLATEGMVLEDGGLVSFTATVQIDGALSAARLHASTLKTLIDSLHLPEGVAVPAADPVEVPADDLTAARRARADRRSGTKNL